MIRVGIAYDLAHSKGAIEETPEEKAAKAAKEQKQKDKQRREIKKKVLESREKAHYLRTKQILREQKRHEKERAKAKQKQAERKARQEARQERKRPEQAEKKSTDANNTNGETAEENKSDEDTTEEAHGNTKLAEAPVPPVIAVEKAPAGDAVSATNHTATYCESEESDDSFVTPDDLSDLSDRELNIQIDSYLDSTSSPSRPQGPPPGPALDDEPDEFELSPWNAVATVGLRVYHKIDESDEKPATVKLRVVRTNPYLDSDEEELEREKKEEEKTGGLDVDDSAIDATLEGEPRERRRSIVGDGKRPLV